jgi:hypothetical protein
VTMATCGDMDVFCTKLLFKQNSQKPLFKNPP